tara:strand:- start:665 stop:946 length:282 start_codon:yes stop_codon:yes gene_type:complete
MEPTQKARYIAIADLALERADKWTKEYDKTKHGYCYYPYLINKLNEEWKHDNTVITAEDYDYIINNTYNLYNEEIWGWWKSFRVWGGLPSVGF